MSVYALFTCWIDMEIRSRGECWSLEHAWIHIRGIVQGVGFRPFVHKLVRERGLCGTIKNTSSGVELELEGERGALESFAESSESMKSRGYSLKGRTAFSIYRFDNRDRSFVVVLFLCLTLITMAVMFNQTNIYYDPEIIMNRVTPVSVIFYAAYAVFLLLPMGLQIAGELKY